MLCEEGDSVKISSVELSLNPCYSGICSVSRCERFGWFWFPLVLILVIVEYALWAFFGSLNLLLQLVLILVIVEYALWEYEYLKHEDGTQSLNPCYSGICSVSRGENPRQVHLPEGLNPCYSGICSVSWGEQYVCPNCGGLNPCYSGICSVSTSSIYWSLSQHVLILVIVEYALWALSSALLHGGFDLS